MIFPKPTNQPFLDPCPRRQPDSLPVCSVDPCRRIPRYASGSEEFVKPKPVRKQFCKELIGGFRGEAKSSIYVGFVVQKLVNTLQTHTCKTSKDMVTRPLTTYQKNGLIFSSIKRGYCLLFLAHLLDLFTISNPQTANS